MDKRSFIKKTALATAGMITLPNIIIAGKTRPQTGILGHGSHKYRVVYDWGVQDVSKIPVKDCHEMIQDSRGRLVLLTNETKNNVIIYDRSGKVLKTWGTEYPGAHGLTLAKENEEDFLFITDQERHQVFKTDLDGEVLMTLDFPQGTDHYQSPDQYKPTEVTVTPNGDFYVADGYGEQHIMHYNHKGELLNIFGGRGEGPEYFDNAHGICYDDRDKANPILLITARQQNAVKRYTLTGEYMDTIALPGASICRPVIDEDNVYFAVIVSHGRWSMPSGFVCILDKDNKVISNPGGSIPIYDQGELQKMHQTIMLFTHPHDVCVDQDKNIYVPQWNSGQTYPIKLERI
ncbi:MAG: 6-bladed beta-propeller [Reichenbachiella sp.]|uniref:6-bladed beta-propeller n=1 Tax=Reichenbachiella sp. TaxID=2184521 RepID=UPI0032650D69